MKSLLLNTLLALTLFMGAANAAETTAKVGQPAPDFTATDTMGKQHKLSDFKGRVVVLEWTNHECPYVKKHYGTENMQKTQQYALDNNAVWLRILSSAPGKQGNVSDEQANRIVAESKSVATATLRDDTGTIGKLYDAKTTPNMYVIDTNGTLVYSGAMDDNDSTDPTTIQTAKNYVKTVLEDLKAGRPVSIDQTKPYGCGIKYAE